MGNYDKHFGGSREQRKKISGSREHELKTFLGTRGFINGEQGIKSKKIKGSWEHVPPPPPWEGLVVCNVNSGSKLRTEILRKGPIKLLHFRLYVRGITTQVTLETFLVESARNESLKQFDYYTFIYFNII